MALSDAYHGETIGALSVGACDLYSEIYKPILMDVVRVQGPDCFRCPYGKCRDNCNCECFEKAEQTFAQYGDETCAMLVEPLLQGSAGMKIYPPLYLKNYVHYVTSIMSILLLTKSPQVMDVQAKCLHLTTQEYHRILCVFQKD